MKTILTITGEAGTGKDTIARWLADREGWNVVVSHTTRPMREGEVDGREHRFWSVSNEQAYIGKENIKNVLAYTVYGGYEYWTTTDDLKEGVMNVYVIDEAGLLDLLEVRAEGRVKLVTMHVVADREVRLKRGVSEERMERDETRDSRLKYFRYDFEIKNNKSMKALEHTLKDVCERVK